jgi:hypothetical protein
VILRLPWTVSFFLTACVDRKDISLYLLEAASTQAREDAIKLLDKYALVTRRLRLTRIGALVWHLGWETEDALRDCKHYKIDASA